MTGITIVEAGVKEKAVKVKSPDLGAIKGLSCCVWGSEDPLQETQQGNKADNTAKQSPRATIDFKGRYLLIF